MAVWKDKNPGRTKKPWCADCYYKTINGKRKRHRRYFATKGEARAYRDDFVVDVEVERRRLLQEGTTSKGNNMFTEYAGQFMERHAKVYTGKKHQRNQQTCLDRHINPIVGDRPLNEMTRADGEKLIQSMLKKGLGPVTVNKTFKLSRKILKHAVEDELITKNPWSGIRLLKETVPHFDWFNFEEADRFLSAVRENWPQWFNLILFLIRSGCRVSEANGLFWEDVDLKNATATIRYTFGSGIWSTTKNGKPRVVDLTPGLVAALRDQKAKTFFGSTCEAKIPGVGDVEGHLVFPSVKGSARMWAPSALAKVVISSCRLAGVKRIRVHDLRHSFASQLRLKGVPLEDIKELLGHSDLRMTLRYAKIAPETKRKAVMVLEEGNATPPPTKTACVEEVGGALVTIPSQKPSQR